MTCARSADGPEVEFPVPEFELEPQPASATHPRTTAPIMNVVRITQAHATSALLVLAVTDPKIGVRHNKPERYDFITAWISIRQPSTPLELLKLVVRGGSKRSWPGVPSEQYSALLLVVLTASSSPFLTARWTGNV